MTTESLLIRKSRWDLPCDAQNPEQNTSFNPHPGALSDSAFLGARKITESACAGKENPMISRLAAPVRRSVARANDCFMKAGATDRRP
jgi:hypothetical protein